jgi:hypothetical protein
MRFSLGLSVTVLIAGFSAGSAHASFVEAPLSRHTSLHRDGGEFERDNDYARSEHDRDKDNRRRQSSDLSSSYDKHDDEDDDVYDHDHDLGRPCRDSSVCWVLTSDDHSKHHKGKKDDHDHGYDKDPDEDCDDGSQPPDGVGEAPIPAAALLFASGLAIVAVSRRRSAL